METTVIISRHPHPTPEERAREEALAACCAAAGCTVVLVPDLYSLDEGDELWTALAELQDKALVVAWLHPRPLEWILDKHGMRMRTFNLGAYTSAEDCCTAIAPDGAAESSGTIRELNGEARLRWYPVVDEEKCEHCGHCLQFCLFGVYTKDGDRVVVTNPDNCKLGCPACSRICPQGAIIFPRYANSPAIAGAPGTRMEPDLAARKMYYLRTRLPCPQCGSTSTAREAADPSAEVCPECGRETLPPKPAATAVTEELDALLDDLDARLRDA
ncbi:MAG: hypothetical protein ACYC7E_15580 [Armatimonadota bacterium]